MTGRRVWTRPGGLVLAHDPDGWPLPAGHIEAIDCGYYWRQSWDRADVWPCHWTHYQQTCRQTGVWRTVELCGYATWRTFWCDGHLPHAKPPDEPSPTCRICGGPMTYANGHDTHPCCDPDSAAADIAAAITLVRAAFPWPTHRTETSGMNATEKHAELIEHGWTTRVDGYLLPPADWPEARPHSLTAAWEAHRARLLAADRPDPAT